MDLSVVPEITPEELKTRMENEDPIVLVDVRDAFELQIADLPEYEKRHIPTSELPGRIGELDPETEFVVYCRSGGRSAWAVQVLRSQGFEKVLNLKGGVLGWREDVDPSLQAY